MTGVRRYRNTSLLRAVVMVLISVLAHVSRRPCTVQGMRLLRTPVKVARGICVSGRSSSSIGSRGSRSFLSSTAAGGSAEVEAAAPDSGDLMVQALNGAEDISVKVLSCREIVQECILKNDLSPLAAKALGETLVSGVMMGASLKGEESLQINLVGTTGLRNVMVITNGKLEVRGMVGQTDFTLPPEIAQRSKLPVMTEESSRAAAGSAADTTSGFADPQEVTTGTLLGDGQIQVVRNHPSWKQPMNGITAMRDTTIPFNLAMYMAESEQRPAVILTDVRVEGNLCRCALGVMVERLPGCSEENLESSIRNVQAVQQRGLRQYLERTQEELENTNGEMFRSFEDSLNRILDDCLQGMDEDSLRWSKAPSYKCSCSMERIWRTLSTLPKSELANIIEQKENVEMKCEFCGKFYSVTVDEIKENVEL